MSLVKDQLDRHFAIEEGVPVGDWLAGILENQIKSIKKIDENKVDNLRSQYLTHVSYLKRAKSVMEAIRENELPRITDPAVTTKLNTLISSLSDLLAAKEKILVKNKPVIKRINK